MFTLGERSKHFRSTLSRFPEWVLCDKIPNCRPMQNHSESANGFRLPLCIEGWRVLQAAKAAAQDIDRRARTT
jgi:hypothetical protein